MGKSGVSTRTMERAFRRYGERVYLGRVGKHSGGHVVSTYTKRQARKKAGLIQLGLLKIRQFWLRAGILAVAYEDYEVKTLLVKAKGEYERNGMICTDTALQLQAGGINVETLEDVWAAMKTAEADTGAAPTDDAPLNSFV